MGALSSHFYPTERSSKENRGRPPCAYSPYSRLLSLTKQRGRRKTQRRKREKGISPPPPSLRIRPLKCALYLPSLCKEEKKLCVRGFKADRAKFASGIFHRNSHIWIFRSKATALSSSVFFSHLLQMTIGSEREKEGEGERRKRTNLPTRHFTRRRVESSQEWKTFGIGDWLQKGEGFFKVGGEAPQEKVLIKSVGLEGKGEKKEPKKVLSRKREERRKNN